MPYGKNALDVALLCGLLGSQQGVAGAWEERFSGRRYQLRTTVAIGERFGEAWRVLETRISVVLIDR